MSNTGQVSLSSEKIRKVQPARYRTSNILGRLQTAGATEKEKGTSMKTKNIIKKILIIAVVVAAILLVGSAGELDHDEYIEANLRLQAQER